VLAFDFGTRFVGVAVGNTAMRVAQPLTTIEAEGKVQRFGAIERLIAEWQPGALVVGRPLEDDGSDNAMTARAERFARQLEGRFGLPVARVDERYTTRAASTVLTEAGFSRRARDEAIDEVAAQLILQAWLDERQPG
jgi:putative holliday junction resolvase